MIDSSTIRTRECCLCRRVLPLSDFPLKYKNVRYKACRECHALGHSCLRPEPKPKRPKLTEEEKKAHRKAYQLEYQRKYRAANREKVREISRESKHRRYHGDEKRKPGPSKGVKFTQQEFTQHEVAPPAPVVPTPVKAEKPERLCETCRNWPCFDGIENLESDFAKEGCHAYRKRGEAI